jgi:hypothetical protein
MARTTSMLIFLFVSEKWSSFSRLSRLKKGRLNHTIKDECAKYHDSEAKNLDPGKPLPAQVQRHHPNEECSAIKFN